MSSPHSAPDGSVGAASSTTPHTSPPESPKPSGHSAQAKESSAAARAPSSNQSQRTNGLRRIEEYELVESIGRGAMGQVFRAHDTLLDRPVAIKVIAAANPTETAQERFLIEARAIARLQHPNVVAIHRIGKHQNRLYIVSELLKGTSLDRIAIPMRWPRALDIAIGIARGLDAAHQNGVLHRDIKPANVMVGEEGLIKLLDFGLAKLSEDLGHEAVNRSGSVSALFVQEEEEPPVPPPERPGEPALAPTIEQPPALPDVQSSSGTPALTIAGSILGTPGYMAPEVWLGLTATVQSDVYSFGSLVFELLAGRLPHEIGALEVMRLAVTERDAPLLAPLVPELPARFAALVQRCLSRRPEDRPESAAWLRVELEAIQAEYGETQARASYRRRQNQRRLMIGLTSFLTLGSLLGMGSFALVQQQRAREQERSGALSTIPRRSIAILPPAAAAGHSVPTAETARVFLELLGNELSVGAQLRRLPSETVAHVQLELRLVDATEYPLPVLGNIRSSIGADLIAVGKYQIANGESTMAVSIQDTLSGALIASSTVKGPSAELFALVSRAGQELRRQLGFGTLSRKESSQILASRPATPQAAQLYALGLDKLDHFDAAGARVPLEQLTSQDSDFPLGHAALADALMVLGYEQKAREHLRRAVELSHTLAPEQRFLIEARYSLNIRDWERAFAAYRALRGAFPDSLDYGLGLAEAQLTASQPQDALATALSLRSLSEQARTNSRIDLLEGRALVDLGQSQQAIQALERAASRARDIGARLIEARAHLEAAYAYEFAGEHDRAKQAAERASSLYLRFGEHGRYAEALIAIVGTQMQQGALVDALATAQSVLDTLMDIKNTSLIADHQGNLAMILARRGQLAEALSRAESGYLLAREIDRPEAVGGNLVSVGWVLLLQGRLERSAKALLEAQQIFSQLKNVRTLGWVHYQLGNLRLAQGRLDEARREHRMGLTLRRENGMQGFAAESELALAVLALETKQPAEAEQHVRIALAQFETAQQRDLEAQAQVVLCKALLLQGKAALAIVARDRAVRINQESQDLTSKLGVGRRLVEILALDQGVLRRDLALGQLDGLLSEASRAGLISEEMELRLLRFRLHPNERTPKAVSALAEQAKRLGFGLLAERAAQLLPS